jgi:hypothetical protein
MNRSNTNNMPNQTNQMAPNGTMQNGQ